MHISLGVLSGYLIFSCKVNTPIPEFGGGSQVMWQDNDIVTLIHKEHGYLACRLVLITWQQLKQL
jgi:hypothetical protein